MKKSQNVPPRAQPMTELVYKQSFPDPRDLLAAKLPSGGFKAGVLALF
jgi:hypothetical protein